jgi:chromosome segregation ATPase
LLLNNKEGLRELREVGIHQLLALKAYIMELDSKLKELLLSNNYLLKKYKSYKEKYQTSLKEHKQYGMTINSLKMKILGYDKLVVKLQGELERVIKTNETELVQVNHRVSDDSSQNEIYKKKFELMREKLEIQEKYKEQEMETFKINYETRIMELSIKVEELKSLRETIELYRAKNEELQTLLSKKETEIFESKILTSSKVNVSENEPLSNTRQTKDIINNLHISLKQNDETIFRLQNELRNKEDTSKRTITKLEREVADLKEDHARELSKKEMDYNITLDQEVKKYKLKISDLEHSHHLAAINHKDEHSKKSEESEVKVRKLESRLQEAESKREEEVFNRRRIEKQILDLNHDKEELQRSINDLQLRITHYKTQERDYEQLKLKLTAGSKQESKENSLDY